MPTEAAEDPIYDVYQEMFGGDDNLEAEATAETAEAEDVAVDTEQPDEPEDGSPYTDDEDESEAVEEDASDDEGEPPGAADATDVVEVSEDDVIRLPDGSEVKIGEAALRQADYTRKTQELADQRRELEQTQEEIQQQQQVLDNFSEAYRERPVDLFTQMIGQSQDPTLFTAHLLKSLADAQKLDPEFVKTFGIKEGPVAEAADRAQSEDRLSKLEQELEQERTAKQEQERKQQVVQTFQRQWSNVVESAGLQFESTEQETAQLREVLQYAVDNEITNLEKAYAAFSWEREQQQRQEHAESEQAAKAAKTTQKKRAAQAMSPRSAAPQRSAKPKPVSDDDAIGQALDELLARG